MCCPDYTWSESDWCDIWWSISAEMRLTTLCIKGNPKKLSHHPPQSSCTRKNDVCHIVLGSIVWGSALSRAFNADSPSPSNICVISQFHFWSDNNTIRISPTLSILTIPREVLAEKHCAELELHLWTALLLRQNNEVILNAVGNPKELKAKNLTGAKYKERLKAWFPFVKLNWIRTLWPNFRKNNEPQRKDGHFHLNF